MTGVSEIGEGPPMLLLVLALFNARSPIRGWLALALSVSSDAARFLDKRSKGGGETGVGGSECFSERIGLNEFLLLESVEMLTGDRGASLSTWPLVLCTSAMIDIIFDIKRDEEKVVKLMQVETSEYNR